MSTVADVILFIKNVLGEVFKRWWEESSKPWQAFLDTLAETWDLGWLDLVGVINLFVFIQRNLDRLTDTIDAFRELLQELALVPQRIAAEVADELIPVPDNWKGRVFRADEAIRLMVSEVMLGAIQIQDFDLPAEIDLAKLGEAAPVVQKIVRELDESLLFDRIKKFMLFKLLVLAGVMLRSFASLAVYVWLAWWMFRIHGPDGDKILQERALPQDSRRVRSRRRGVRQYRVNARSGPDT